MQKLREQRLRPCVRLGCGAFVCALLMCLPKVGYENLYFPGFALLLATHLASGGVLGLCYPMAAFDEEVCEIRRGSLFRPAMLQVKREAVRDADIWNFRHIVSGGGSNSGGHARSARWPHLAILLKNGEYVVADRFEGEIFERARRFAQELKPPREIRRVEDADCTIERRALWAVTLLRLLMPAMMAAAMWLRWRAL